MQRHASLRIADGKADRGWRALRATPHTVEVIATVPADRAEHAPKTFAIAAYDPQRRRDPSQKFLRQTTRLIGALWLAPVTLPHERLSVITGFSQDIGNAMITFTGSVAIGNMITAKAVYTRPVLELGRNNAQPVALSNSTQFGRPTGISTNDFARMQTYHKGRVVGTVNI